MVAVDREHRDLLFGQEICDLNSRKALARARQLHDVVDVACRELKLHQLI